MSQASGNFKNSKKTPYKNNNSYQQSQNINEATGNLLRVPPQSLEAEESVLGAILLDNDAVNIAIERLVPEDFYKIAHAEIFGSMVALSDKREPVDVVSLTEELKSRGVFDNIGGINYISRLASAVPSASNISYYVKIVKEHSLRRKIIRECCEITNGAYQDSADVESFLDTAEQKLLAVSDYRIKPSFFKVSEVVQDSIRIIETLYDKKEIVTGVPSGFIALDKLTAGFQGSDLIIIAARPSMGKTSLAMSIAGHVGIQKKKAVAVFSLEMSKEQLVLRMLCSEARVDNAKVRTGYLGERDFPKLVDAASKIAESTIYLDDTPAITVSELRAKCRRLNRENKLSAVLIDYLQLMRSPAYSNSREQEIADISRSLKALAKELNVPVIALSQLNRSVESRNDKRPVMSDLRESGAIEQDADIIMFIYRDEVYNPDTADKNIAEVIISKQRNGPTGVVRLSFNGGITRFDNLEERDELPSTLSEDRIKFDPGTGDAGEGDFGTELF